MLHQSTAHFEPAPPPPAPALNHRGQPIFDAAAYVDAMRAVGAELHPIRGTPGTIDLDGTYTVEAPAEPKARRRVAAIEKAFAPGLAADPAAAGRIAEHLILEAAAQRFAAIVGDDWSVALRELQRLSDELHNAPDREDDDPDLARAGELASEAYLAAFEHALAMPIRRPADLGRKAEFARRFCNVGDELKKVLGDIATFERPDLAGTLPDVMLIGA